jgi:hypothetical protein
MDWMDSPPEILTMLSIAGIIMGALFWVIDSRLGKLLREFKPNGGSSVRDQLNRIEAKVDGHIGWHMDRGQ